MTDKQNLGKSAPDGAGYATLTDGNGNLVVTTTVTGTAKQNPGVSSPDGSKYLTLTDGSGALV